MYNREHADPNDHGTDLEDWIVADDDVESYSTEVVPRGKCNRHASRLGVQGGEAAIDDMASVNRPAGAWFHRKQATESEARKSLLRVRAVQKKKEPAQARALQKWTASSPWEHSK